MILFLCTAPTSTGVPRGSISAYFFNCRSCGPYFLFYTLLQRAPAPIVILFLHSASTGASAGRTSTFAHRIAGLFFLHVSTYWFFEQLCTLYWSHHHLSPAAVTTLCHPLPLSSPITWRSHHHLSFAAANITITCCSYLHLTSPAVTITYLLLQSPPSVICSRCHHLLSAAATTTCYLLPLPPPFIKSIFICCCSFVSLIRLGYTPINGHSCLPNIR